MHATAYDDDDNEDMVVCSRVETESTPAPFTSLYEELYGAANQLEREFKEEEEEEQDGGDDGRLYL